MIDQWAVSCAIGFPVAFVVDRFFLGGANRLLVGLLIWALSLNLAGALLDRYRPLPTHPASPPDEETTEA